MRILSGGNKNYVNILDVSGSLDLVVSASDVPTVNISAESTNLAGGETTTLTFVFSGGVTNFDANDVTVTGGTLSGLTTTDNITWTATLTADSQLDDVVGSVVVGTEYDGQVRVNTSSNAIGVGNGPTIASGDTLTINLYDNVAGSSGKFDDPPTPATGSLNPVQLTSFSFTVATVQGSAASTTSFKVTYIDGNGDLQTIDYPDVGADH